MEISETNVSPLWTSTRIENALVVRQTENSDPKEMEGMFTRGIITPRGDGLVIDNVRFFNFDAPKTSAFGSCSHCWHSASTDSGARTVRFSKLSFTNVK